MNVYDEMNNLCKAIKESHEFKLVQESKGKLKADKTAEDMVQDFLKKKQALEIQQYQGKEPSKDDIAKVEKIYDVIKLNPVAADYVQNYVRFQMMIADISKSLGDTIKEAVE
ncbi:MAG: YlbF family regulator [Acidaminococcaceae bacterium]|jgi:cell fate (sporulation/competence/biofilm development) regulator YlbF (YheA/YmcA/DUF963 family)|nr:YlbF family regulator [Acidaminococcaceae bacterium]